MKPPKDVVGLEPVERVLDCLVGAAGRGGRESGTMDPDERESWTVDCDGRDSGTLLAGGRESGIVVVGLADAGFGWESATEVPVFGTMISSNTGGSLGSVLGTITSIDIGVVIEGS